MKAQLFGAVPTGNQIGAEGTVIFPDYNIIFVHIPGLLFGELVSKL